MIKAIHKKCGKIAFHVLEKWRVGDFPKASNVVLSDGSHPEPGSPTICESCGEHFFCGSDTLELQHWKDWFIIKN